MVECALFPYSHQYFELLKEAYELDLQSKYLESWSFYESNRSDYGYRFDESYFPKFDQNVFYEEEQKQEQKEEGFFQKVLKFLRETGEKIIAAIRNLFSKITGRKDLDLKNLDADWKSRKWTNNDIKIICNEYKINLNLYLNAVIVTGDGNNLTELNFANEVDGVTRKCFTNFMNYTFTDGATISEDCIESLGASAVNSVINKGAEAIEREGVGKVAAKGGSIVGTLLVSKLCSSVKSVETDGEDKGGLISTLTSTLTGGSKNKPEKKSPINELVRSKFFQILAGGKKVDQNDKSVIQEGLKDLFGDQYDTEGLSGLVIDTIMTGKIHCSDKSRLVKLMSGLKSNGSKVIGGLRVVTTFENDKARVRNSIASKKSFFGNMFSRGRAAITSTNAVLKNKDEESNTEPEESNEVETEEEE